MFLLRKPSEAAIRQFLSAQQDRQFSYPAVGATRAGVPAGYQVDHNRVRVGTGPVAFERAVAAVRRWEMFHLGWTTLCWRNAPIAAGSTVAMLASFGFWTLNACRIVYVIEEDGPVQRYGFAYGTLPDHVERGEERFMIEWRHDDDSVWYDILAYSRPHHILAWIGYPVVRMLQRRFARDSKRAMVEAVQDTA